jgi:hypothetical protein
VTEPWFTPADKLMELCLKQALAQHSRGFLDPRDAGSLYDCTILVPTTFEIKYDKRSQDTGNLYFETRNTRQNIPSGIMTTRADWWAHYLPTQRCIAVYPPATMRDWLTAQMEAGVTWVRQTRPGGGDQNSQGIVAPIVRVLAQSWVEQWPFHVEVPVLLHDLSGVGFFCPGCRRLRVVESFQGGTCESCHQESQQKAS